ncbi:MAG: M20/M25/M40 family metallo-hydrolase [Acidimicrobiia bacterium]|nr:M20/M25/M40 family metallo-hydrolase [Acidimicrobiia bacterium]
MPVRAEDGALAGPGTYDMKGGLVQMLFALRAVAEEGLELPALPVVLVNADEEQGSRESTRWVRALACRSVRAFVLEPSFGSEGRLKTARKGVGRFRLRVRGTAAHAGIEPERGVSAVLEISHQIQSLFDLNDVERGITVNVGTVDGGLHPNVVAPEASADVDVRVLTEEDAREVEKAIHGLRPVHDGITLEVEGGFRRPPMEPTARNRALWEAARGIAEDLGLPLGEATVGGASDGNTASLYTATLDGLGAVGRGAHAVDERVVVARMPERAALLALLLASPVGGPRDGERA